MTGWLSAMPDGFALTIMVAVIFAAGVVRGFTGFGFSAIVVSSMALVMDPLVIIPMVMLFELVASALQVGGLYHQFDKAMVARLLGGAVIAMPIGVSFLVVLDINTLRMVIAVGILFLSIALLTGWSLKKPPGSAGQIGVGLVSGLANSAAIGGLPVGLFLAAQDTHPKQFRATMIGYLFALDVVGIAIMVWFGKISPDIVKTAVVLFPAMMAGVVIGSKRFISASPDSFRTLVILLLIGLSLTGMAKSFL